MSKKDMDRRKKFILELMGDPIYQPMRLREISSLLRLSLIFYDLFLILLAGKIPAFFVLIHLIDFAWISSLYLLYHKR